MSTFFCYTCRTHKHLAVQQPGTSGKGSICVTCHERRAQIVARGGTQRLSEKQTRSGQRAILRRLSQIGEI